VRRLQRQIKEMMETNEQSKRETDEKREENQSSTDRQLLDKNKKKKKGPKKGTKETRPTQEPKTADRNVKPRPELPEAVIDRGTVREGLDALPGDEWTVENHYVDKDGRLLFGVEMYGLPLEQGEGWDYGEKKDLTKDGAGDKVLQYILEKANYPPWSTMLPKKKQSKDRCQVVAENKTSKVCEHNVYDEGLTYRQETNPGYCKDGYYLAGVMCSGCQKKFVPDKREEFEAGKEKGIRPRPKAAVYCCVNLEQDNSRNSECKHALCAVCWSQQLLSSIVNCPDGGRPATRKRRRE
jgi:hypothetical protein